MLFLVTISNSPLEFDSLAALKCRVWQPGAHRVYTMARIYLLNGTLQVSFSAFERQPPPDSAILLRLGGREQAATLQLYLSPQQAMLLCSDAPAGPADMLAQGTEIAVRRFSGVDEQGWYWGGALAVPEATLAQAGIGTMPGAVFSGVLEKHQDGRLMGASCAADTAGQFTLVAY